MLMNSRADVVTFCEALALAWGLSLPKGRFSQGRILRPERNFSWFGVPSGIRCKKTKRDSAPRPEFGLVENDFRATRF